MFGGYWSSARGDIKYLIYRVTSQNHVIEVSCNFVKWKLLISYHRPAMFGGHRCLWCWSIVFTLSGDLARLSD